METIQSVGTLDKKYFVWMRYEWKIVSSIEPIPRIDGWFSVYTVINGESTEILHVLTQFAVLRYI